MSELINARQPLHRNLLTTVSTLALLGFICRADRAQAADSDTDRPTVWIELGGQFERVDGGEERFAPPFSAGIAQLGFVTPVSAERPARFANGGEGKISFEPDGSDWVFSASVRYGRSLGRKHQHTEDPALKHQFGPDQEYKYNIASAVNFADALVENTETHTMLDFQAGKDVGLGMFGLSGNSKISAGIRFAQFASRSQSEINSDQNVGFADPFTLPTSEKYMRSRYTAYRATFQAQRSFSGVGPSISWDASASIAGSPRESGITFDWGANAAILFGRQKARIHQTTASAYKTGRIGIAFGKGNERPVSHVPYIISQTHLTTNHTRSRMVTVPNIGGFAGLSFHYAAAKLSLGYRGDFFFGALDGGIDIAKKENRGFYGPFATISVGLGG